MNTASSDEPAPAALVRPPRWVLFGGALFIAYHVAATLVNTAPPAVREPLWPMFEAYGAGLRMTGSFGVFSRFTSDTSVVVYGVTRGGERQLLSHSSPQRRAGDRITKIQRRFRHQEMRERLAPSYLAYFCKSAAARGLDLERAELVLERAGKKASSEVVLSARCGAAP